nr:hypothetical protein [Tanacetum cinerariifolium]
MASNFNNENDPWEYSLDIDDSDLHLTPVLCSSCSARVEPSPYTPNLVTIIPGHADEALMSTQEYIQKVVEDVGEDDDFNSGAWFSAANYVIATGGSVTGCLWDIINFLKKGKLEHVVAIVKSCSSNVLGDLTVTMKDLSCTIPGTVHHKVISEGGYGKDITMEAAMILANISVFTPKPSEHYLNITMRNVVKESAEEHDIDDEYHTEENLTKKEQHQLDLDEEALREVLEEEKAQAEKEQVRAEKE